MAVTQIARSHEGNLGFLDVLMQREFFRKLFWARFAGFSTIDDQGIEITPHTPLVIKRELAKEGFDFLKLPLLRKLTNDATFGDKQLEGNAEAQNIYFLDAYLNQTRHAVAPPAKMANQRVKNFRLEEKARPQLEDWFAEEMEIQIAKAFYESFSSNITATTANGGFGFTPVPHPHIFTADNGEVTWNATVATYETNIVNSVNNLTDTSSDYFSTDALESLRVELLKLNIPTFNNMWPMLIHYNQAKQLRANATWQQAQREANVRSMMDHPIWTGALGAYAGFVLYERNLGVMGVDVSGGAGSIIWGQANSLHSTVDTLNHKAAIVFGPQAMCQAWAEGPFFVDDDFDLKNRKEVGAAMIAGFKRSDFEDATATPTARINQSSALLISYSPDGWA